MYKVYGHRAVQHADDNSDLCSSDQRSATPEVIYTTDDKKEADEILKNGGFIKDDVWHVAVRVDDDSVSIAEVPKKPAE